MAPTRTQSKSVTINVYEPVSTALGGPAELKCHAARDASNWNSLLRWHRRSRGPQWDYSTAMYHVDQGSSEYYGGVVPAQEPVKAEEEKATSPDRPTTRSSGQAQSQTAALRASQTPSHAPQAPLLSLPPMPAPMPQSTQQQQQAQQAYPPEARAAYEAMMQRARQQQGSPPQQQQPTQYNPPQGFYPGQNIAPQMMFKQPSRDGR